MDKKLSKMNILFYVFGFIIPLSVAFIIYNLVTTYNNFEVEGNKYASETIVFVNPFDSDVKVEIVKKPTLRVLAHKGRYKSKSFQFISIKKNETTILLTGVTDELDYSTDEAKDFDSEDSKIKRFRLILEDFCEILAQPNEIVESYAANGGECMETIGYHYLYDENIEFEKIDQGWLLEQSAVISLVDDPYEVYRNDLYDFDELYVSITLVFEGKNKFFYFISTGDNLNRQEIEEMKEKILENTRFVE